MKMHSILAAQAALVQRKTKDRLIEEKRQTIIRSHKWIRSLEETTAPDVRLPTFLNECDALISVDDDPLLFWGTFMATWPYCENTWDLRYRVLEVLRRYTGPDTTDTIMQAEAFIQAKNDEGSIYDLPDLVEIYRGCSKDRVRGLSWTTRRDVAEAFVSGTYELTVPNPVIAQCSIPKKFVFTLINERRESEVLIDFEKLPKQVVLCPLD